MKAGPWYLALILTSGALLALAAACGGGDDDDDGAPSDGQGDTETETGGAGDETNAGDDTGGGDETASADETAGGTAESTGGSGAKCKCADPGVKLVVVSGCADWPDAEECSGWHSVACLDDTDCDFENMEFEDGETHEAYDCTIRIECP